MHTTFYQTYNIFYKKHFPQMIFTKAGSLVFCSKKTRLPAYAGGSLKCIEASANMASLDAADRGLIQLTRFLNARLF